MAFGQPNSGGGGGQRSGPPPRRGGMTGGGGAPGAPRGGGGGAPRGGGGGGGGRGERKSVFAKAVTLYTDKSALELQTVAEWFKTGIALKFAAALKGNTESGARNYDHDNPIFYAMDPSEAVALRLQLRALLDGRIGEIRLTHTQGNAPHKVLSIFSATELQGKEGDLAVFVEEYANGYSEGVDPTRAIAFFAAAQGLNLGEVTEKNEAVESIVYPDLEVLYHFVDSYLANIARVDFASVRLISENSTGGGGAAPRDSVEQPMRRGAGPASGGAVPARRGPTPGGSEAANVAAEPGGGDVDAAFDGLDEGADKEVEGM